MPTVTLTAACSDPALSLPIALTFRGQGGAPRIELSGVDVYEVDLAMLPSAGAQGTLVWVDRLTADGQPANTLVTLTWVSGAETKSETLAPGGAFLLASPATTRGITELSLAATSPVVVHVIVLG